MKKIITLSLTVAIIILLLGSVTGFGQVLDEEGWQELFGEQEEYVAENQFGPGAEAFEAELKVFLQAYAPREEKSTDPFKPPQYAWTVEEDYEGMHESVELDIAESGAIEGNYRTWLTTVLTGGKAPEIVWSQEYWCNQNYGPQGLIVDLKPFLELPNPYIKEGIPGREKWKDSFPENALNAMAAPGGEQYMLPGAAVVAPIYYNKDIFEEAGVTPPETWSDLISVSKKIEEAGYLPVAFAGSELTHMNWLFRSATYQVMRDLHEELDIADQPGFITPKEKVIGIEKGLIDPTSDRYKSVWPMMKEWSQYFGDFMGRDLDEAFRLFITGDAAMVWHGSWMIKQIIHDEQRDFDWGGFHFPLITKEENEYASGKIGLVGGPNGAFKYAIPQATKEQGILREAVDFMMFLYAPQNAGPMMVEHGGFIPIIEGVELPEDMADLYESLEPKGEEYEWEQLNFINPGALSLSAQLEDLFVKTWQQYIGGQMPLDQAMMNLKRNQERAAQKMKDQENWDLDEYLN